MTAGIDAISTARDITATYRRYLQSLLAVRDPKLHSALREEISNSRLLHKGPYLEATPPYRAGASCRDLIQEGVLHQDFAELESPTLPLDRPLYAHQEKALRKVAAGRNVVVSTGTGSGKTESFLLPILDSLVAERAAGTLGPGVRAILLYPMNALANDQMKRLRSLLQSFPDITFGRYTGDTQENDRDAEARFAELNIGEPRLPNELISRQTMRDSPPHLLLTNYAMLEYLLLRPLDNALFPAGTDSTWRFIVVDEAHVYDGTQGAEIGMLLRRLKERVSPPRPVQCIATSATVGAESAPAAVTEFAHLLFGEQFEFVPDDDERQDLVTAERVGHSKGGTWGRLTADEYIEVASSATPEDHLRSLRPDAPAEADLVELLRAEQALTALRVLLASGPAELARAASQTFPGDGRAEEGLSALVDLASRTTAQDGTPVLSARYHLFLRATEGAFTCLSTSGPHVELARHESCPTCAAAMFEIGSCKRCGAVHVVGRLEAAGAQARLRPRSATAPATWLLLSEQQGSVDEDEVAVEDEATDLAESDTAKLCGRCGLIVPSEASLCTDNTCGSDGLRVVRKLKSRGSDVAGCLHCGARGAATVRLFETGADASTAVIGTALYQRLPADEKALAQGLPGAGRKLLAFSDSRQSAAYFAPYLEDSYGRLQRRRLLAKGLLAAGADHDEVAIDDLVFEVSRQGRQAGLFGSRDSAQRQMRHVAPWVMAEVVATDDRASLEGLGLLRVQLLREDGWQLPPGISQLGLEEDEGWAFLQELVRTLRQQGAVTMPDSVEPNDEIFAPRLGPIFARLDGPTPKSKVLSWLPGRGTNRRVDYVRKVLARLDSPLDPMAVLKGVWRFLTESQVDWLRREARAGQGEVTRVDHELLRLSWPTADHPVYRCAVCRRVTSHNVRNVCPALGCDGDLAAFFPDPAVDQDHYRTLYRSMLPVPLTALEHTAQWTSRKAAEIQQSFINGTVNALSCSTTFELGVDVGELQAVLLRNMPPTTANYVQRAGRAGRRTGSAALVVTFAQRRSHDLAQYADPLRTMAGTVRAPYVPLVNERLDRRHAHSIALSQYFRAVFDESGTVARRVEDFFLPTATSGTKCLADGVADFLSPPSQSLRRALTEVLPDGVHAEIGLDDDAWAGVLINLVDEVRREVVADIEALKTLADEASAKRHHSRAGALDRVATTLKQRELLGFLANRNVIPKYGFPVDTVELRTGFATANQELGQHLELSRDLSRAIYEYSPGSKVVAGGQVWTSRGLYRLPGRDLVERRYLICKECNALREGLEQVGPECQTCGHAATEAPRTLTIPEFGFIAERETVRPGLSAPRRSWGGSSHVRRQSPELQEKSLKIAGGTLLLAFGPRARLVSLADGPGGAGFLVCDLCGYGSPRIDHPPGLPTHDHLRTQRECSGRGRLLDLAHEYETDLVRIDLEPEGLAGAREGHLSLLYALLEAACDTLQISRDDLGGTLVPRGRDAWSLAIFDTVPGGAGHALQVTENLDRIIQAAVRRMESCDCGEETSCYGCLRSYSNQREHEVLSRGLALHALRQLQ